MSYSRRPVYSRSPSPYKRHNSSGAVSRSLSRSMSRSRSRSRDATEVENPGNNLYVTGLSPRVTKRELEEYFSSEGTVMDVHLVVDPWTRDSRGFGFVTMSTVEEANRCIKHLDRSVLEGRVIMVEKARRRRGRTPTPGRYLGLKSIDVRRRSRRYSPYHRSRSPRYSSESDRSRSPSPFSSRHKSHHSRRSHSRSRRKYSRSPRSSSEWSYSPVIRYYRRRDKSYSPYERRYSRRDRSYSPYDCHYRGRRFRSTSCSISPRARRSSRRYSPSVSPMPRRSYSPSLSPRRTRTDSPRWTRSDSPRRTRSSRRQDSYRGSSRRGYSRDSISSWSSTGRHSISVSSRSVSRSVTPKSTSPSS